MNFKYLCLFLVLIFAVNCILALEERDNNNDSNRNNNDDDDDSSDNGHIPAYCRRFKYNGQPRQQFQKRYKFMLDEFNLNRLSGEVWQNPTRTYGILAGTDVFVPISDVQYFWSDVVYNQAACQFEYIQVWPALNAQLGRVVYRVQRIAAILNRPTYAAGNDDIEGPPSFKPVWISPPIFEHAAILQSDGQQVVTGPHAADTSFFTRTPDQYEISNEQRSVLIANQRRYYSLVLGLGSIPPGFATSELKMFWYSTTVQAPRDVRIAITKFIAGNLPLLPDPNNPGLPGYPNIYIYVPPAARDEENDSPVTVDNISLYPYNSTVAAELYKQYLHRHSQQ